MTEAQANAIYDVLVEVCGAAPDSRDAFVWSFTRPITGSREYRFIGNLGFGGKFWDANGRWYVNCYREDETAARLRIIEQANERLAGLRPWKLVGSMELIELF